MFILATSIPVFSAAPVKSQTIDQVAVSLTLKNESLVKAFHKIESQSSFHFMYRNDDVKDILNLDIAASNKSIAVVLKAILSNTLLKFRQIDDQILITKSNQDKAATGEKADVTTDIVASKGIIKGTVTDSKESPLAGVTVKLDGAISLNKATDVNGNYSFSNLPAGNYTLTFTFVGFKSVTKTLALGEDQQSVINVALTESTNGLDEVVVTGYGTQKKR
jgi:iron complex outermembrane receptor protein